MKGLRYEYYDKEEIDIYRHGAASGGCACFYICIFMDTWISDYKVHSKARVRIITEGLDTAMLHWMAT